VPSCGLLIFDREDALQLVMDSAALEIGGMEAVQTIASPTRSMGARAFVS